jgi:hypothetical protein
MAFRTDDARYAWLNRVLGVMTGDFDEKTGRADWRLRAGAIDRSRTALFGGTRRSRWT